MEDLTEVAQDFRREEELKNKTALLQSQYLLVPNQIVREMRKVESPRSVRKESPDFEMSSPKRTSKLRRTDQMFELDDPKLPCYTTLSFSSAKK